MKVQTVPEGVQIDPQALKHVIEECKGLLMEGKVAQSNGDSELAAEKATEALAVINNAALALIKADPQLAATVALAALGHRSVTISETQTHKNESRRTKGLGFFLFAENSTSYNTLNRSRKVQID